MMIGSTTIVFTRYFLLECLKREEYGVKTFGELFFQYRDDIRDMDLKTAIQSLMGLFVEQIKNISQNKETIKINSYNGLTSKPAIFRLCLLI